jgi:general secretion pathway protein H
MGSPRIRRRCAPRASGFTLIEIMVVVLIIGVISAGIMLSINLTGRDKDLERESERFAALVNYAREQSELQTREYGLIFQNDSYEFVSFDTRRGLWRTVFEDDALVLRHLPDGLDLKLVVESRPIILKRPTDAQDKTPQVMIYSTGDLTSFQVTLEREGGIRSISLSEDDTGKIVAKPMVDSRESHT